MVYTVFSNSRLNYADVDIFVIAITAEAMSGALAAGRRNMDLFGVALIAFITALGGGTARDVLPGNYSINWTYLSYIYLTTAQGYLPSLLPNICVNLTASSYLLMLWAGCFYHHWLRHRSKT